MNTSTHSQHLGKIVLLCLLSQFVSTAVLSQTTVTSTSSADLNEFGGHDQEYGGDGDLVPPHCQVQAPSVAQESFFISWNCEDNTSSREELRSELWLRRSSAKPFSKVSTHLGFPASVEVTQALLEKVDLLDEDPNRVFTDLLPIQYRLLVSDRAGVTAMSQASMIQAGSEMTYTCGISLNTDLIPATETTSGIPALFATNSALSADVLDTGNGTTVRAPFFTMSLCEISPLCDTSSTGFGFNTIDQNDGTTLFTLLQNAEPVLSETLESTSTSSSISLSGTTEYAGSTLNISVSCSASTQ